jgi:hypothetical protein
VPRLSLSASLLTTALTTLLGCHELSGLSDYSKGPLFGGAGGIGGSGGSGGTGGGAGAGPGECDSGSHASYQMAIMADQPIGYWRLGEANGAATAANEVAGTLAGSYEGLVTFGATGAVAGDTAVSFDGVVGKAVFLGDDHNMTADFSIEAWALASAINEGARHTLVSKGVAAMSGGYRLEIDATGHISFTVSDATNEQILTGRVFAIGSFAHVVVVVEGGLACLYIDGDKEQCNSSMVVAPQSAAPSLIGAFGDNRNVNFVGTLDEVAIYDRALSWGCIVAHHAAATP